jgi:hypothetical protein
MSYAARPVFSYGEYKRFKNHASLYTAEENLNLAVKYDWTLFYCYPDYCPDRGDLVRRGIKRTPYSLRHFYIPEQLKNGVDAYILARNTGRVCKC